MRRVPEATSLLVHTFIDGSCGREVTGRSLMTAVPLKNVQQDTKGNGGSYDGSDGDGG